MPSISELGLIQYNLRDRVKGFGICLLVLQENKVSKAILGALSVAKKTL